MSHAVIPKNLIKETLDRLIAGYRVVAPVREQEILEFGEVRDVDKIILTDEITYKSPKEFLFPQVEKMMSFNGISEPEGSEQERLTIIFGVRPCDLEALKILTSVFTMGKFADEYFVRRLNNTILVGTGCTREKPGCFCRDRGINKSYSKECDVFLRDGGDFYAVEIFTDKGASVLKSCGVESMKPPDTLPDLQGEDASPAIGRALEIQAGETELFGKVDWERISEKCLGCGLCTYICPTCHCFEFKDVAERGIVNRYKCWDSCMYPKFTLHASGHNPRPSKKERYRQRVMHKYLYIKQNFGYTACTGCGRCIRSCPAGMNIKSVVLKIMEELS